MLLSTKKTAITLAVSAISSFAVADGVIEGRVSDQSGEVFFDGAIVELVGTTQSAVAAKGGFFRFNNVPAGSYSLSISYIGAETVTVNVDVVDDKTASAEVKIGEDVTQVENVLVIGQAAGALNALNQMRAADNLVTVVSADSIGQFPDENVADALQRVPGVFIQRDQGEGRFVGVRGIDPRLNVATVNGVNLPAPESDRRNVALDVIPSDLLEGLEVTKTLTPDLDADSIGGTINIKSLSAFDRKQRSYKVKAQNIYNELEGENGYKFSGSFTDIFDVAGGELGVAISASKAQRKFGVDNIETDGGFEDEDGIRITEEMEMRNYRLIREREGFAVNLDYRANENASYFLRTLHSNYCDQEYRDRIEFKLDEGDISFDENSLTATGTELQRELKDRFEEQEISSLSIGGENNIDNWTIEYSLSFSEAKEREPSRIDSEFEYSDVEFATYQLTGGRPLLTFSDDALDLTNYELKEFAVEDNYSEDEESAFKVDIKRDMQFGDFSGYIKFGGKVRHRDKTIDMNASVFEPEEDVFLNEFAGAEIDYKFGQFGVGIDPSVQRAYVNAGLNLEEDTDETILASNRDSFIEEDVTALYAMSRVDIDKLRLVYGVRYEETQTQLQGANVIEGDEIDTIPVAYQNDYSHWLPSINARFEISENLIGRAAYTESIARPSFGDINPSPDAIEYDEGELEVEAGNPNLQPYEAQNVDLSLEFYPEDLGVFSAGVFYKNIDNFIFSATSEDITLAAPYSNGLLVEEFELVQPQNGTSAELYGLELAWTRQFKGALDGFLLMANATLTDSEADLGLGTDADRSSKTQMPLQSDTVANFVVAYENHGVSLRLSTALIGKRIAEVDLDDANNDLYESNHTQIDFSAKYDVTDKLQVFFNAVNLNEEPSHHYHGSRRYNAQFDEIGRSFTLGLSYRNF